MNGSAAWFCLAAYLLAAEPVQSASGKVDNGEETFFKALTDNVEKYKQIHFEWNIKNMDSDKFQSLWAIEAEMEPDINLDEMRYDDNVRLKKEAKIDSLAQTMQYGGKCGVACLGKRDSDKGSNDKDIPRPMMYSNKKQYFVKSRSEEDVHPHGMMYSDKRHNLNVGGENVGLPRTMRYSGKKQKLMMNVPRMADTTHDQHPQNMMYIDESSDASIAPRAMMTTIIDETLSQTSQTAISDGHQDIIEEIKPSVTAEPIIIKREKEDAYSGEFGQKRFKNEGHPRTMRYANKKKQQMMTNFQEITDTKNDQHPQNTMYIDESSDAGRVPRAMMTYVDVDVKSSQTAISDGHQDIIEEIKPSVTAEPIIIKREKEDAYSGEFGQKRYKNEGHPRTMRYANKKKQQMMTNFQEIIDTTNDQYPQNMMYIDESSDAGRVPRAMMTYVDVDVKSSQTAISDGHQDIIGEIKPSVTAEPIIIKREKEDAYSGEFGQKRYKNEGHPRTMRYVNKKKQQMMTNFQEITDTTNDQYPQNMMYIDESSDAGRVPRAMMTYVDVDVKSSQTAISDGHQDIIEEIKPSVTAEPIIIKREKEDAYSGEFGQKRYKNEGHPPTMRYANKKKQQMMTNFQEIIDTTNDQYPQNMMYIDESSYAGRVPRAMMTYVDVDVKSSQTAISDGHQDIIEEIKHSVTAEPIIIKREKEDAYSGEFGQKSSKNEGHPRTMRYANKKKQQMMTNFQEIIDTTNDQYPQNMMYIDESSDAGRAPRAMMTTVDEMSSQTAISDGHQEIIEEIKPVPVPAETIIIKREKEESEDVYSRGISQKRSKNVGHPRTMRYSGKKKQQMMTNFEVMVPTGILGQPKDKIDDNMISANRRSPRTMKNTEISQQGQIQYPDPDERIVINRPKGAPEDIDPKRYTIESQEKGFPAETKVWYNRFQNKATAYVDFNNSIQHSNQFPDKSGVKNHRLPTSKYLIKQIPNNTVDYFKEWKNIISVFSEKTLTRKKYVRMFPKLSVHDAIKDISNWHSSLQLFWPFVLENAVMIQKLALLGISGKIVPKEKQKLAFFQELEKFQTIKIPVAQDKIILSFNHTDLVEGLRRAGLLETSEDYLSAGLHLYKPEDQLNIESKVNAAMDVINKTSPELYLAITQLIGSIAFYKAEHVGYAGGSISSALGVIWQDPRAYKEFSVSHYAEQIVHEFIHNTLFLVDMVKGLFVDQQKFLKAKVWSPIRHQLRSYDRTFHACYVSTGVSAFHAQAGHTDKAETLATALLESVDDLVTVNDKVGVLTESGEAALQAMMDYLILMRLK